MRVTYIKTRFLTYLHAVATCNVQIVSCIHFMSLCVPSGRYLCLSERADAANWLLQFGVVYRTQSYGGLYLYHSYASFV
jgi:hypothetical protein